MLNKLWTFSKDSEILNRLFITIPFAVMLILTGENSYALDRQTVVVREALTGDSVRLEGGKTLKYIGVQSPPLQSIVPLVREYGHNALEFNKSLVEGRKVQVEWDLQIRDNSNTLLGYVFMEDGTFLNKEILKQGHGKIRLLPPNLKYAALFRRAELEARRERKGLWKEEPKNPFIKSEYVGEKNTKIYYFPTSPELDRIPKANLVMFASRVEAKAAGYRPCFTCNESNVAEY